jgi:hypothetical protein
MMMNNVKRILGETGRTISDKDRGLASMMDNEPRMENRSPEDQIFAIEAEIENMMRSYETAVRDGDTDRAQFIADVIDKMEQMKIERQGSIANKTIARSRPEADFYAGPNMAEGGEAQMQMSEQEAMAELEGIAPQAQMIEQLIMAVIQMIQQGVSEAEVREFLKEQGLDDEDIEDLFMMVMQQIEQAPAEEPIGRELQGIM